MWYLAVSSKYFSFPKASHFTEWNEVHQSCISLFWFWLSLAPLCHRYSILGFMVWWKEQRHQISTSNSINVNGLLPGMAVVQIAIGIVCLSSYRIRKYPWPWSRALTGTSSILGRRTLIIGQFRHRHIAVVGLRCGLCSNSNITWWWIKSCRYGIRRKGSLQASTKPGIIFEPIHMPVIGGAVWFLRHSARWDWFAMIWHICREFAWVLVSLAWLSLLLVVFLIQIVTMSSTVILTVSNKRMKERKTAH